MGKSLDFPGRTNGDVEQVLGDSMMEDKVLSRGCAYVRIALP